MTDTTVRLRLLTRFVPVAGPDGLHGAELPVPGRADGPLTRPSAEGLPVSSVTTRTTTEVLEVVLSGDVDLLLGEELTLVLAEAEAHCRRHDRARVHVDVSAVGAVDSTAVRFLERLRRSTAEAGGACTLTGARPAVQQVLDLARTVPTGVLAGS